MSIQLFEIGATYGSKVNIETLSTVPNLAPKSTHIPYTETAPTLDGGEFARGAPQIKWTWGYIPVDMFDALRAICPAGSASVIIRSRPEDGGETTSADYAYYSAQMIWPALDSYRYETGQYREFELTFRRVASYTP